MNERWNGSGERNENIKRKQHTFYLLKLFEHAKMSVYFYFLSMNAFDFMFHTCYMEPKCDLISMPLVDMCFLFVFIFVAFFVVAFLFILFCYDFFLLLLLYVYM